MSVSLPTPFTPAEFQRRLDGLRAGMARSGVGVAVLVHSANLVYFTGLGLHGQLVVPLDRDPVYLVQINHSRALAQCWLSDVRPSLGFKTVKATLAELGLTGSALGLELDVMPFQQAQKVKDTLSPAGVIDISEIVWNLRMVKSAPELAVMTQAGELSAASIAQFRSLTRPGVSEATLFASMVDAEMHLGADCGARTRAWNPYMPHGIVLSGPNTAAISGYWMTMTGEGQSAAQPYGTTARTVQQGDLVVYDRVISYQGYVVDEARTVIMGEADARQRHYWAALETVINAAIAAVRPGQPVSQVYTEAYRAAKETGIAREFMTLAEYDFEYLGHGVGLEMDEGPLVGPRADMLMAPGMTLALEPKVIVPGWGGLTLEETVAVTPEGHRLLTQSPRHPLSIVV